MERRYHRAQSPSTAARTAKFKNFEQWDFRLKMGAFERRHVKEILRQSLQGDDVRGAANGREFACPHGSKSLRVGFWDSPSCQAFSGLLSFVCPSVEATEASASMTPDIIRLATTAAVLLSEYW
jgi:hypothetical protein